MAHVAITPSALYAGELSLTDTSNISRMSQITDTCISNVVVNSECIGKVSVIRMNRLRVVFWQEITSFHFIWKSSLFFYSTYKHKIKCQRLNKSTSNYTLEPRSLLCRTNTEKVISQSHIKKSDKHGYSHLDFFIHKYLKNQINTSWVIRFKMNWLHWDSWLCNAWVQKFESGAVQFFVII